MDPIGLSKLTENVMFGAYLDASLANIILDANKISLSWNVYRYINGCRECKGMVTLVRTISPSHFENGTWKTGGTCERSKPYNKEEAANLLKVGSKNNVEWKVRNIQMEEIKRAREEGGVGREKRLIQAMDITNVMLMRPDGHPGFHWRDKKKKGFNDCVHWCVPGPIDAWNDLLLELLRRAAKDADWH